MVEAWIQDELQHLDLGDTRRNQRCREIVSSLAAQPASSVPQAMGDWAATKGGYRFWDNEQVEPEAITAAHQQRTRERAAEHALILAVQDTTDLDLRHHPATDGLGALGSGEGRGLKLHSTLAVSADGVPLGLLTQELWARDPAQSGQRQQRRQRSTAEKESGRWLTGQTATEAAVPEGCVITVADREADIFDLFVQPRRPQSELLIRLAQNRRVDHPARYLREALAEAPELGRCSVAVGRRADRQPEPVTLSLQAQTLTLQPPRNRPARDGLRPVTVQVVLARELDPPAGVTPIDWLFLTTLAVTNAAAAERCLWYYSRRWLIERYHYVLKGAVRSRSCNSRRPSASNGRWQPTGWWPGVYSG